MKLPRILPLLALLALPTSHLLAASSAEQESSKPADCCAVTAATCPVSGEELGSMGDPYVHVYKREGQPDREVSLCCKMCVRRFEKDPESYLAKAEAAADCCAAESGQPTGEQAAPTTS